jgi:hypothetical protein
MVNGASLERVVELGARIADMRKQLEALEQQIRQEEAALQKLLGSKRKDGVAAVVARAGLEKAGKQKGRRKAAVEGAARRGSSRVKTVKKGRRRGGAGAAGGTIMESIVELLEGRRNEALSVADIAGALGAKPTSVATMLKRLLTKGRISRPETGRYAAA